jgi:ankyrin repeat protein
MLKMPKIFNLSTLDATRLLLAELEKEEPNMKIIVELVKNGADVNIQNEWGYNLLIQMIMDNRPASFIMQFVDLGADINLTDDYGWNALWYAAQYRRLDLVKELLMRGADRNRVVDGQTLLDFCGEEAACTILTGLPNSEKDKEILLDIIWCIENMDEKYCVG